MVNRLVLAVMASLAIAPALRAETASVNQIAQDARLVIEAPPIVLIENPLDQIVQIVKTGSAQSHVDIVDYVMWFVHENSVEHPGPWHDANWLNGDVIFSGMVNAYRGYTPQKPFMTCGPRSVAMGRILHALGIKSRQIGLFTDDLGSLYGHQLIEVQRMPTGRWEAYDPTWSVFYINRKSGKHVSVMDILFGDLNDIVPTSPDGLSVGWEAVRRITGSSASSMASLRYENYFSAVQYYSFTTKRRQIMVVNTNRFDVEARLVNDTPFRQWADKIYGNPEWILSDKDLDEGSKSKLNDDSDLPLY